MSYTKWAYEAIIRAVFGVRGWGAAVSPASVLDKFGIARAMPQWVPALVLVAWLVVRLAVWLDWLSPPFRLR